MKDREYMNTNERIEEMIKYLMQSKNYRAALYKVYFIVLISVWLTFVMINHIMLHILITLGAIILYLIMTFVRKNKEDLTERMLIECNFNREEFLIIPSSTRFLAMGVYRMSAYYVEQEKTYKISCNVEDDQSDLYRVMIKIREKGVFPKLKILVNPNNHKDYKALGCQFIEETLWMNKKLVAEELENYYGQKWNY